jgi:hypothetical protein
MFNAPSPRRALVLAAGMLGALAISAGAAHAAEPLPTGSPQEIVFEHSGKVLNVAGAGTAAGTPLIQWPDLNGGFVNDQFKFVQAPPAFEGPNRYYIQPVHAGNMYVGAVGTILDPLGQPVQLMHSTAGRAIVWHAEPAGDGKLQLVNQKTNRALNVANASTANGASVIQWERQMFPASPFHNDHVIIRAGN